MRFVVRETPGSLDVVAAAMYSDGIDEDLVTTMKPGTNRFRLL